MFINKALILLAKGGYKLILLRIIGEIMLYGIMLLHTVLISNFINDVLFSDAEPTFFSLTPIIFIAVCISIEFLFSYYNQVIGVRCGTKIKGNIRNELMDCVLFLGPSYVSKKRSGDMVSSLVGKVEAMESYYTIYLPNGIATIFWAVIVISYLATINIFVALTSLAGMIIVLFAPNIWRKIMFKFGDEDWTLFAKFKSEMMDNLQGMPTLKAFNGSDTRGKYISKLAWEIHAKTMKHLSVTQIESGVLIFGAYLGSSMSVGVAIWQSIVGNISTSELVMMLFLITACFTPTFTLIETWHLGYHGIAASPSVFALLKDAQREKNTKEEKADTKNDYIESVNISFNNVSFAYEKNSPVLKNVSLTINKGEKVALVGKSGSGKSTIINLISGFYLVDSGEILVNGESLDVKSLREVSGTVWQEPYLFYGSIRDNICLGLKDISENDMIEASKMANIHSFIADLPAGYDTQVGERGLRLSGGEKQRIAIARCFLRNPQFLIFDEATSNLDMENEETVTKSMENLLVGRTALIVAHRLSTIKNADKVYVLDGGEIVQSGTPEKLAEIDGIYRELMQKQEEI